jgi:hypothetical protein
MFFKNRIAFIPPLAEAGGFCDDYDKSSGGIPMIRRSFMTLSVLVLSLVLILFLQAAPVRKTFLR